MKKIFISNSLIFLFLSLFSMLLAGGRSELVKIVNKSSNDVTEEEVNSLK